MTTVHQLLPVFSPGDAIGGATRITQVMLRELGYRSEIYADVIDQRLQRRARPAVELLDDLEPDDAVLYHLSIGSDLTSLLGRAVARRIVVYHNITPSRYYLNTSPRVVYWLERGRRDLATLAPRVDLLIADSQFNLDEAVAAGAQRGVVIPPPVDLERLHPRPSAPAAPPEVLFVGRLAPNKSQHELIRVLAALRATHIPDARLVLAGTGDDTGPYEAALRRLAVNLGVADAIDIPARRLDDAALTRHYMNAAVFACSSEHEGFCMPLLEAMAFEVPIVAYDRAATPGTLRGAGLVLASRDPLLWAETLRRTIEDHELREQLITAGRHRLADFSHTLIRDQLAAALTSIGVSP